MLCLQQLLIHAHELFASARILAKTVVSDPVKPCGKSRFAAKATDVLVSPNKSFLREIVGQGNVCACELSKQAAHSRLMIPNQLCECVMIIVNKREIMEDHTNSRLQNIIGWATSIVLILLSATLLDTVVTPILFLMFGRKPLERLLADQPTTLTPAEAY